jgi:hypothetical protein
MIKKSSFDHFLVSNSIIFITIILNNVLITQSYDSDYYQHNNNNNNNNHNSYLNSAYDSRYFKHGTKSNELNGGTCKEFLELNSMQKCCTSRDDDCFMIHYDTRCYCDMFCDRSKFPDNSDCCPDSAETCNGIVPTQQPTRRNNDIIKRFFFF